MIKIYIGILCTLLIVFLFDSTRANVQNPDSLKARRINSLIKILSINDQKANQVIAIDDKYRLKQQLILSDREISEKDKREKINELIVSREQELRNVLTPGQMSMVVPQIHLQKNITNPDSIKRKRNLALVHQLSISEQKAAQVNAINDLYKANVNEVVKGTGLSEDVKRKKIDALIVQKNKQLTALLTTAQLEKILATTDRKKGISDNNPDSSKKQRKLQLISKTLGTDEQKTLQVSNILDSYHSNEEHVINDQNLSSKIRQDEIRQLNLNKKNQLSKILNLSQMAKMFPEMKAPNNKPAVTLKDVMKSKEGIALRDSFNQKFKVVFTNKNLSQQEKLSAQQQLIKEQNVEMMKILLKKSTSTTQ